MTIERVKNMPFDILNKEMLEELIQKQEFHVDIVRS